MRAEIRRLIETTAAKAMLASVERRGPFPMPTDSPIIRVAGGHPYGVLVVGGMWVAGGGVGSQRVALAGHLARQLATMSGHGIDLEAVGVPFINVDGMVRAVAERELDRYDLVLLLPGGIESATLRSSRSWRAALRRLIASVHDVEPTMPIAIAGIPQLASASPVDAVAARLIAGATARLNRVTESLAATLPGVTFLASLELLGEDETRRAHGYARGAEALTPALTAILATSAHPRSRGLRTDETERQHAVDRLGILDSDPDPRFDTLAQQAALLLHMSAAAITFADRDRQWIKSAVGLEASDLPRAGSLCDITLVTTGAFCVDDIRVRRPELGQRTQVMDAVGLVSYAGYPLEDAAGVPIGTLCVADTAPHRFTAQDIALLRGLALQAQALLTAPVAESPRLA